MQTTSTITIGTRGSKLALWQAEYTQVQLKKLGLDASISIIKTKGDKIQDIGFSKMEGKGFFTKEIEDALLNHEVDLAVHSMKDLPTISPKGLTISAVSYREDPSDLLLIKENPISGQNLGLVAGAVVGTSSARRKAQLLHLAPEVTVKDIRGNVPTRVDKLRRGEFDAIILAAAGINRLKLDLNDLHQVKLNPREMVPAPAQGVLAWQTREDDVELRRLLKRIHNSKVAMCTNIERKVLRLLDGGCQTPLGVYCTQDVNQYFHVDAAIANGWDQPVHRVKLSQSTSHGMAESIVEQLNKLMNQG